MAPITSNQSDEVGAKRLRSFVDRIERLNEEKDGISADIRDIYAEAKGTGYCTKALRKLIALRKIELEVRREQEELLQLYQHAMGMLDGTPLGNSAKDRYERETQISAQALVDSTKGGGSLEISAGGVTVKIEDGKVVTPPVADQLDELSEEAAENAAYRCAVTLVRSENKASPSFVQRSLKIGFNRAAALVERMEAEFVVSAPDRRGKRTVLPVKPTMVVSPGTLQAPGFKGDVARVMADAIEKQGGTVTEDTTALWDRAADAGGVETVQQAMAPSPI